MRFALLLFVSLFLFACATGQTILGKPSSVDVPPQTDPPVVWSGLSITIFVAIWLALIGGSIFLLYQEWFSKNSKPRS